MAKKRTKKQKQAAKSRRIKTVASKKDPKENTQTIADIAFTGDKIHLVKKDLLKTVAVTAFITILLFGIYVYLG